MQVGSAGALPVRPAYTTQHPLPFLALLLYTRAGVLPQLYARGARAHHPGAHHRRETGGEVSSHDSIGPRARLGGLVPAPFCSSSSAFARMACIIIGPTVMARGA